MTERRIGSTADPEKTTFWTALDRDVVLTPSLVAGVADLNDRFLALGLAHERRTVDPSQDPFVQTFRTAVILALVLQESGLARQGVDRFLFAPPSAASLERMLAEALEVTKHNPMPDTEWSPARATLEDGLLAILAGVSVQSIRRYAMQQRQTPDDVAARLHFVALVNSDLAGSYNERGIRRWWQRPRAQLNGRSPLEWLGENFNPDGEEAAQVRELAAALLGAGAAT